MKHYWNKTKWPLVSAAKHNAMVDDYNILQSTNKSQSSQLLEIGQTLTKERAALGKSTDRIAEQAREVITLKERIQELKGAPQPKTFQTEFQDLQVKVDATNTSLILVNKVFGKLKDLWNWRLENGKAGPKALSTNRIEINEALSILDQKLPTKVGK